MTRTTPFFLGSLLTIVVLGCVSTSVDVYMRAGPNRPALDDQRVAVLPTLTGGQDPSPALAMHTVSDRVFVGKLGVVEFVPSDETVAALADAEGLVDALRAGVRDVRQGKPVEVKGEKDVVLAKGAVTVGEDESPQFRMRSSSAPLSKTFPDYVDVALLQGVEADFMLVSVATQRYLALSDILALFGILPLAFGEQSFGYPPVAVYALYETTNGERVWEGLLGAERAPHLVPTQRDDDPIDPRAHAVIGAAHILTGDARTAMERALGNPGPAN